MRPSGPLGNERHDLDDSTLLTVPEACQRLRISRWMFYRLLQRREIKTIKIGSRRLVPPSALADLVAQLVADERGGNR